MGMVIYNFYESFVDFLTYDYKIPERLSLNRKGHEGLLLQHNFSVEIDNNIPYGGVNRFDFQFSTKQNKLIKTVINAY